MFKSKKVKASEEIISMCKEYLKSHNLGNRGFEDGTSERQLTGLIGEVLVYQYIKGELPDLKNKENGFDGGFDLEHKGSKIDVKTMGRNSYVRDFYVNNFYLIQEHYISDNIIFCSYHKRDKVLEICGWIAKDDLPKKGKFYKKGTTRVRDNGTSFVFRQSNYEVMNKFLEPIDAIK